jgi:phosphoglycolate phosphatase-like HAD superfamily hydrolase
LPLFNFEDDGVYFLGTVREVDTRKVSVHVSTNENLRKAKVGQLVSLKLADAAESWLIGLVERMVKSVILSPAIPDDTGGEIDGDIEEVTNSIRLTLVGTARWNAVKQGYEFSRSLAQVPDIEASCFTLKDQNLETLMGLLSTQGAEGQSLALGSYSIDETAIAYLDGDKFFQRHAALLGSTGSGKSWTVASILERASVLPSSNLIVFDLHGEYKQLSYARQLRVPGPSELGQVSDGLLYLPYWMLNTEEMQSMFIDRSEYSAHNQVSKFQELVVNEKRRTLEALGNQQVLDAFTLDSPIPYSLDNLMTELNRLNSEMVPGANNKEKKGPFNGDFDRLLVRMRNKIEDRRYGFLFKAPDAEHQYDSMARMAQRLMNHSGEKGQIKVIDFSDVPSDILPVIVGLVARVIYQIQFWTNSENRHPLALVCDEAHLYLPKKDGKNPVEQRAIEAFEKIAKEGRKYGVSLLIVSQRPSDVSTTVLSQCNNIISLRLTNGNDQSTVKKLMPESLESLLEVLPIMDVGEALVVGDAVLLPSRIRVTPPEEKPLSATINFWEKWMADTADADIAVAIENMRKQGRDA